MERQGKQLRRILAGGKQKAVAAEIVEADPRQPQSIDQRAETASGKELERQEVVALQARIMPRIVAAIDRTERQRGARGGRREAMRRRRGRAGGPGQAEVALSLDIRSKAPFAVNSQ